MEPAVGNLYRIEYIGGRVYDPDIVNCDALFLGNKDNLYLFAQLFTHKTNPSGCIYYIPKEFIKKEIGSWSSKLLPEGYQKLIGHYNTLKVPDLNPDQRLTFTTYFDL